MLRLFFLCFVLFILIFPAYTQESALPFAYVTMGEMGYDLWIMDSSGEVLQSFETELNDCPYGFSDDGRWMLYSQGETNLSYSMDGFENYLLNIETGESLRLDMELSIQAFAWSGSGNLLAYLDYAGNLSVYDLETHEEIFGTENLEMPAGRSAMRFRGRELSYVLNSYDSEILSFHHWDGSSVQTVEYSHENFGNIAGLELSPNGRFLKTSSFGMDTEIIELATGEAFYVGSGISHWMPDEAAMLFALQNESDSIISQSYNIVPNVGEIGPYIGGNYVFDFSTDGSYLSYFVEDEFGLTNLWQMNRETGESALVVQDSVMTEVDWLTDTSFVYVNPPPVGGLREVYIYDASNYSNQQLSNQPEVDKSLLCDIGVG